jgi:two-component system, OmpR family, alkaline phosphatase synthesis response regulator PhoP
MSVRRAGVSKILVVEDDPDIADLIRHSLEKAGHAVEVLATGTGVVSHACRQRPDLIVLDLMLPGQDGMTICRALRGEASVQSTPVIMVTARAGVSDRVAGLELGADDYITKPFSPRELVARVAALLRRARPPVDSGVLRYGPVVVDRQRHIVLDGGTEVKLTAKEYLLLVFFLEHQGRVLSRDLLLSDVWGYRYTGGTRTVDVHVRRLREKLPFLADSIVTVKQFGYKLDRPEEAESGRDTPAVGAR